MKNVYMTEEEKNRFKGYMVSKGYNFTSLAKEIGMSRESLSLRASGKVDFGRKEMNKIADVLNVEPSKIFFDTKVS